MTSIDAPGVKWVPYHKVRPQPHHPFRKHPHGPLYESVRDTGFWRPGVAVRDDAHDCWHLRDGHHRWWVIADHEDIQRATGGLFPIIEIEEL